MNARVADRLIPDAVDLIANDGVELPINLAGKTTQISASIGIVTYSANGDGEDTLLRRADAAMYAS